jgi:hypothetical protein
MPQPHAATATNRLLIPLALVSLLCVAEAVVIAFLVGRGHTPPPVMAELATPTGAQRDVFVPEAAPPDPARPAAPAIARGKVGQRVESNGIAMTVAAVSNEPRFKEVFAPSPSEKFVDVEVLIENRTAKGFGYYSNQFTLKDDKDRSFSSTALGAGQPALGWGTVVPGDKVRGHLAFVLPRDATSLTLTCPIGDGPSSPHAIHIELGQ